MDIVNVLNMIEQGLIIVFAGLFLVGGIGTYLIRRKKRKEQEEARNGYSHPYYDETKPKRREKDRGDEIYDGNAVKSYSESDYSDD